MVFRWLSRLTSASPAPPPCRPDCWLRNPTHEINPQTYEASTVIDVLSLPSRDEVAKSLYKPIKPWQTRILRLKPGKLNDPLRCEVVTVDLVHCPGAVIHSLSELISYDALSYTWGKPVFDKPLICNDGLIFPITRNLFDALRRIREQNDIVNLWVDAICINQLDGNEKSEQVRQMFIIYKKARRVIAWLGEHDNQSELVVDLIQNSRSFAFRNFEHQPQCIQHLAITYDAYNKFLSRPWFRRTWVRQECAAAQTLIIKLGHNTFTSTSLQAIPLIQYYLEDMLHISPNSRMPKYIPIIQNRDQALLALLQTSGEYEQTDPRDKVFSILDMSDTPTSGTKRSEQTFIEVDYSKTLSEIYQETTKYLIWKERSLEIIYDTEFQERPSGFPRWTLFWGKWSSQTNYSLGDSLNVRGDFGRLNVKGWPIGKIIKLTNKTYVCCKKGDRTLTLKVPVEQELEVPSTVSKTAYDSALHRRRICRVASYREYFDIRSSFKISVRSSVREGDILAYVVGCKLPFVLRQRDNVFEFHGPATNLSGWVYNEYDKATKGKDSSAARAYSFDLI